jgi:hypothetical protein
MSSGVLACVNALGSSPQTMPMPIMSLQRFCNYCYTASPNAKVAPLDHPVTYRNQAHGVRHHLHMGAALQALTAAITSASTGITNHP